MLVDNETNQPMRLYDLMGFNRAFQAYDRVEGANCLTTGQRQTQLDAAVRAVKCVGLNQTAEVKREWFADESLYKMFFKRLEMLKKS